MTDEEGRSSRVLEAWARDQQRRALIHERTSLLTELDALEREQFALTLTARQERAEADALEGISPTTVWLALTGELASTRERERSEASQAFARTMELGVRIGGRDARVLEIDQTLRTMGDTWAPVVTAMAELERHAGDLPGPRAALEAARRLEAIDQARYHVAVAQRSIGAWWFALLCADSAPTDPELVAIARSARTRSSQVVEALEAVDDAFAALELPVDAQPGTYRSRLDAVSQLPRRPDTPRRMLELLPILARDLAAQDPGLIERSAKAAAEADLSAALTR
ncbi:MAG: hypothetical protein R3F61_30005 [Myxococcota bacterium]